MLWNSIYEFFIRYVFGGRFNNGVFSGTLGNLFNLDTSTLVNGDTATYLPVKVTNLSGAEFTMPLGNYLSLLATIISIIFIVVLCCLFVYKIVKLIGGLIR